MTAAPIPTHQPARVRRYTATRRLLSGPPALAGDERAACSARTDLPWVPEPSANVREQMQMRAICHTCPILAACARHAVDTGPVGFYAATWIPAVGRGRSKALAELRRIAASGAA